MAESAHARTDETNRLGVRRRASPDLDQGPDEQDRPSEPAGVLRRARQETRSLGPGDVLGLQRTVGNHAVGQLMSSLQPSIHRQLVIERTPSAMIQRVATNLVAGLDADKPSTYDTGGGHSYADHGAQTTKEQHVTRVKTGVAPSGRVSRVPPGKGSSKFASDDTHKLAFQTAFADIKEKNKNKQRVRGAANAIDVAGAGPIYYKDGSEETCEKVQLDIVPVDDTTIRINSMYPVKG